MKTWIHHNPPQSTTIQSEYDDSDDNYHFKLDTSPVPFPRCWHIGSHLSGTCFTWWVRDEDWAVETIAFVLVNTTIWCTTLSLSHIYLSIYLSVYLSIYLSIYVTQILDAQILVQYLFSREEMGTQKRVIITLSSWTVSRPWPKWRALRTWSELGPAGVLTMAW